MAEINWRLFLYQLFEREPKLARQIAEEINVKPITLLRWARGEATPHHPIQALQQLARAESFVQYSHNFVRLAALEYPNVADRSFEDSFSQEIPSSFYHELLLAHVTVSEELIFWTIARLVSQQITPLLDPEHPERLAVTIFLLTPPAPQAPWRSLYTPSNQPKHKLYPQIHYYPWLIGAESPMTHVLLQYQPLVGEMDGMGIVTLPIQKRGKAGGILVLHHPQEAFFTPPRLDLAMDYARALTLALTDDQFATPAAISLATLPARQEQEAWQRRYPFAHRVRDAYRQAQRSQPELEMRALQALEADLIETYQQPRLGLGEHIREREN